MMKPKIKKCFYCPEPATMITIDTAEEMIFLCDKHYKMFRSKYPKERYKQKEEEL